MATVNEIMNTPDRLFDMCTRNVARHIDRYIVQEKSGNRFKFKRQIILPVEISEQLFQTYQRMKGLKDEMAYAFSNRCKTPLQSITLDRCKVTDSGLKYLLGHYPTNLEINQCESLSPEFIGIINNYAANLTAIKVISGQSTPVPFGNPELKINAPHLKTAIFNQYDIPVLPIYGMFDQIKFLDLSECKLTLEGLPVLRNLTHLMLYNIDDLKQVLPWVMNLTSLLHLDISRSDDVRGKFSEPNVVLASLIANLPRLQSLDISGTNLAGSGAAAVVNLNEDEDEDVETSSETSEDIAHALEFCDIPGLAARVDKPLRYLGLYGTSSGACRRLHIPARRVSSCIL